MGARTIARNPADKNFYLLDANFLVNRFISPDCVLKPKEKIRVEASQRWWDEIDRQVKTGKAFLYVPDVCVAEAFRVLAKKYYLEKYFRKPIDYKRARDRLSRFLHMSPKALKAANRAIHVHDISTSRDVVVAVDRFNETLFKHKLQVSVVDVLVLATAKYLVDFFHIPRQSLFVITLDNDLWRGSKKFADVPSAFNPCVDRESASNVFV